MQKNAWTEEEERILVAAHERFGNRWAEIAKLIDGRTENAIKNHWNATKRRQSSRRKHNKKFESEGENNQSFILQDYINNKYYSCKTTPNPNITTIMMDTNTTFSTASPSSISTTVSSDVENPYTTFLEDCIEDESASSLATIMNPPTQEMLFMQTIFWTHDDSSVGLVNSENYQVQPQVQEISMQLSDHLMMITDENSDNNNNSFNSDRFLFHLLHGGAPQQAVSDECIINNNQSDDLMEEMVVEVALYQRKDMDLFEMINSF